jgi:hypothetical protein
VRSVCPADRLVSSAEPRYVGGELLVEPSLGELEWALARSGLL